MPDPLLGFRPPELCSSRAAVRRLRRLSPPGVGLNPEPTRSPVPRRRSDGSRPKSLPLLRSPKRPSPARVAETTSATTGSTERSPGPPKRSRLGGFSAPSADRRSARHRSWIRRPHPADRSRRDEPNGVGCDLRPKPMDTAHDGKARERPHLQGFAPRESPPPYAGGLDHRTSCSSPGLSALQGSLPRRDGPAFTAPPLMCLPARARTTSLPALQGVTPNEIGWSLSRLPTLLGFSAS
jgi:hypothetical protein